MPQNINLYADALVLMACLGAALYCLRLGRELRQLRRVEGSLGKAIRDMSQAAQASREAFETIREEIRQEVHELDTRCVRLRFKRQEIDDLLDTMEGQVSYQARKVKDAQTVAESAMLPLLNKAEVEIRTLTQAIETASALGASRPAPRTVGEAQQTVELHRAARRPARPTTEHASNPFLRSAHG